MVQDKKHFYPHVQDILVYQYATYTTIYTSSELWHTMS